MKKESIEEIKKEIEQEKKELLKKAYIQAREEMIIKEIKEIGGNSILPKILKKDKWDGRDLGIIEMREIINSRRYYNKLDFIELTETEKQKYIDTFKELDEEQQRILNGYRYLKIWLLNSYYLSLAHIQTRTGKYNYLIGRTRDLFFTETAYNYFMHNVKETDKATNDLIEQYKKHYDEFYRPLSIERYTDKDKDKAEHIDDIEDSRTETFKSYIFLKGYNQAIDIIADFYEIPDLILFKYKGIIYIPEEYNKYNILVANIRKAIDKQYISSLEKILKQATLNDVFKPLKTYYEIPEEKIKQAKDSLSKKDFAPFLYTHKDLLNILCI